MSYSSEAKREICAQKREPCCQRALLSALVHCAGSVGISREGLSLTLDSSNPDILRLTDETTAALFGIKAKREDGGIAMRGITAEQLIYLGILKNSDGFKVEEGINPDLIKTDCCKKAYLAGAFLGGGSLTVAGGYHLELSCLSKKLLDDLVLLLSSLDIHAGTAIRAGSHIAYIKDSEGVSDILAAVGAGGVCLGLNSLFVKRSMRREASRAANCDEANLNRQVAASLAQTQAIEKLTKSGGIKNAKLLEAARARVDHPDFNYDELSVVLSLSKSTVKYRLNQLVALAQNLPDQKEK